jgi:hypothetical protein
MMWRPTSVEDVKAIVAKDLLDCDPEQTALWNKYAVEPFRAPIERYGKMESVVVVARNGSEVIY